MEMNDIDKVIQDGQDMTALMEDDKFKKFFIDDFEKLSINLVAAFSREDEPVKQQIRNQMMMISGVTNYCQGIVQAGEMATEELKVYNEEIENG